ncbi:uncharacterized protein MYCGRDRAFT_92458 [Zymoseptoria tritici IPO323]|uniref:Uncharacterized protein n=1 Tax=Zymoseptoria tritici (strain CBS 115943 / IPO323) TaxID=336722 RepID=F9X8X2_ZYMTI|nr:uncharacterized protein MYCGRDRAFT_92458 [Zymoseptoria tritici IPO323]EGP87912.1 hypothetical protein MYCGRDRAFT_92458 [Zymoseptoria tritici IPO323]
MLSKTILLPLAALLSVVSSSPDYQCRPARLGKYAPIANNIPSYQWCSAYLDGNPARGHSSDPHLLCDLQRDNKAVKQHVCTCIVKGHKQITTKCTTPVKATTTKCITSSTTRTTTRSTTQGTTRSATPSTSRTTMPSTTASTSTTTASASTTTASASTTTASNFTTISTTASTTATTTPTPTTTTTTTSTTSSSSAPPPRQTYCTGNQAMYCGNSGNVEGGCFCAITAYGDPSAVCFAASSCTSCNSDADCGVGRRCLADASGNCGDPSGTFCASTTDGCDDSPPAAKAKRELEDVFAEAA